MMSIDFAANFSHWFWLKDGPKCHIDYQIIIPLQSSRYCYWTHWLCLSMSIQVEQHLLHLLRLLHFSDFIAMSRLFQLASVSIFVRKVVFFASNFFRGHWSLPSSFHRTDLRTNVHCHMVWSVYHPWLSKAFWSWSKTCDWKTFANSGCYSCSFT